MIVVGVDFSSSSLAAVRWALAAAVPQQDRVVLLHAGPPTSDLVEHTPLVEKRHREHRARLHAVAEQAGAGDGCDIAVVDGSAAGVLVAEARDARLLVVGRRGGFSAAEALLLGSVARDVVRHAHCPVVVVPKDAPAGPPDRVIVGVDESPHSAAAADCAAVEASAHGVPLQVERVVGHESAGAALAGAAPPNDLLVVGTHGRGAAARLLLGSTSTYCIEHATCPVVVVPLRH